MCGDCYSRFLDYCSPIWCGVMRIKEIFDVQSAVLAKAREETAKDYKSKEDGGLDSDLEEDLEEDAEEDVVDSNGDLD